MLNLFGANAFARKRKVKARPIDIVPAIESLEERLVLASQVMTVYSNGNLTLSGSGDADNVIVSITGTNTVTLTTGGTTPFTGAGAGPFVVTGNLTISLGNGDDILLLQVDGVDGNGILDSGDISIDLGAGNDTLTTGDDLTFTGNASILGGTGNDTISLGSATASVGVYKLTIDGGTDTGVIGNVKQVFLNGVTSGSDVSVKNSGTLPQNVITGNTAPNSIGGNLTIVQSSANIGGYTTSLLDTSVAGSLSVTNGNTTSLSSLFVTSLTVPVTIGGPATLTSGNAAGNNLTLSGVAGSLTFNKNLTVKNGNSTGTNNLNVFDVIGNGSSTSFTNGNGASNTINISGLTGGQFSGSVTATNGTSTGANIVNAGHLFAGKGLTVTNGTSTGLTSVTLGSPLLTDTVVVSGNVAITNASTFSIPITINRLTASGNVTIANGTTGGGETIVLGGAGPNLIGGNLSITNQASAGVRVTSISQTTVQGRSGVAIYNVGAGTSIVDVGTISPVTILSGLTIQDGTGIANLTINSLSVGSLNYKDLGGGVDNINLAAAAGSLSVSGVTRIDTANGSDTVNIATTGTAAFNGLVSIILGSGDDTLLIGPNAASPAFSTANRFQFDGGTGFDTIFASPLSLADFVEGTVPGKLKSKIASFEVILYDVI